MQYSRVYEIINNKEKSDVFYKKRPVWIQELTDNIAKVGFIDNFEERDVHIKDLYENKNYKLF